MSVSCSRICYIALGLVLHLMMAFHGLGRTNNRKIHHLFFILSVSFSFFASISTQITTHGKMKTVFLSRSTSVHWVAYYLQHFFGVSCVVLSTRFSCSVSTVVFSISFAFFRRIREWNSLDTYIIVQQMNYVLDRHLLCHTNINGHTLYCRFVRRLLMSMAPSLLIFAVSKSLVQLLLAMVIRYSMRFGYRLLHFLLSTCSFLSFYDFCCCFFNRIIADAFSRC